METNKYTWVWVCIIKIREACKVENCGEKWGIVSVYVEN